MGEQSKIITEFQLFLEKHERLICYGAGGVGAEIFASLCELGRTVDYFVETKKTEEYDRFGVSVKEIDEISDPLHYGWIVSVNLQNQGSIVDELEKRGITNYYCISKKLLNAFKNRTLRKNRDLLGVGNGKRCFILGMGPTIREQDLRKLRDEDVLSCSWCSLLDDYPYINPQYYISPAAMNDPISSKRERNDYGMNMYSYRDTGITSETIILDYVDKPLVLSTKAFRSKKVYYIDQTNEWENNRTICNIEKNTPYIQTATIMVLKLAIYMGYQEIYLLGTEHDIIRRRYEHSYDIEKLRRIGFQGVYDSIMKLTKAYVKKWKTLDLLRVSYHMYDQYHYLHEIARDRGIHVYNATVGGDLDEFERVDYKELF